ncbi:MAG: phosphate ABC transporter substrate-binding protein [Eubacteriales bacterium]
MKRLMGIVLICIMVFGLLAGCSETENQTVAGKLALGGSTSVEKVIQSMMESYMAKNKDVTITYAPTGSSTGIQGAAENTLDIGLSSRGLKDEEKSTLKEIIFALDGIAIIINNKNTITDLDLATLALIAKGEIKNWSEVGGTDTEIVVIGRDAASGTRDGFESIVGVKEACAYAEEQASTGAVIASVQSNTGAIGYVSLSSVDEKVKTLTIEGVEPNEANVKDGSYKIQRPFVFAVKNDSDNALADDFINWAVSSATTEMVRNAGAVPVVGDVTKAVTEAVADKLSGKLSLGGSTSVEKVIQSMMEAFMSEFNDVSMTYAPTGSSTGIQGATEGSLDIGLSSRGLKDEEKTVLDEIVFAIDGIAIIVNNENTITDLDLATLALIAKGEIKNWSEVGGGDMEIVMIGRDAASGTRDGFESIVGVKEACVYAEEQASTGAVIASVQSNTGAIGYVSLSSVDEKTKALTVEGIEPSEATVKDGSYKIQRPFVFAVKVDSDSSLADTFIKWAVSSATTEIVRNAGAVPVA